MNITNRPCTSLYLYPLKSLVPLKMVYLNTHTAACRDIFLYLSVCNILISNGCQADKYKNMSLQTGKFEF